MCLRYFIIKWWGKKWCSSGFCHPYFASFPKSYLQRSGLQTHLSDCFLNISTFYAKSFKLETFQIPPSSCSSSLIPLSILWIFWNMSITIIIYLYMFNLIWTLCLRIVSLTHLHLLRLVIHLNFSLPSCSLSASFSFILSFPLLDWSSFLCFFSFLLLVQKLCILSL